MSEICGRHDNSEASNHARVCRLVFHVCALCCSVQEREEDRKRQREIERDRGAGTERERERRRGANTWGRHNKIEARSDSLCGTEGARGIPFRAKVKDFEHIYLTAQARIWPLLS